MRLSWHKCACRGTNALVVAQKLGLPKRVEQWSCVQGLAELLFIFCVDSVWILCVFCVDSVRRS